MKNSALVLRIAMAIILLSHAIPGMFDGGINDFGNLFLNQIGFSPLGVPIAWAVKLSHVLCAALLLLNRYVKPAAILTILVLIMGIILVHFKEGWFVVGGGRNGVEYNFLLICVLIAIMFQDNTKNPAKINP
ncbi:DoxX family protein [Pedobacter sp. UC225_65]|uniref:DoxX family protein n=1 Tax=Pedobacter sp. UC225_65 TaxID=3350173 RepID=UPI0036734662